MDELSKLIMMNVFMEALLGQITWNRGMELYFTQINVDEVDGGCAVRPPTCYR